jgi:hypothetical protein
MFARVSPTSLKMRQSRFLLVATLAMSSMAQAKLSPKWIDAKAFAPNIRMLIHESSAQQKSAASFVAIQDHSAKEPKVMRLFASLKASGKPIAELSPNTCYFLKRAGLTTRQTWCLAKKDRVIVFVEQGVVRMTENELTELELSTLAGGK